MWSTNRRRAADCPGTGHVDWVGLDCYVSIQGSTYANTVALDGCPIEALIGKLILLAERAEWARLGYEPGKIRDLLPGVRRGHLPGLVWYDVREHGSPAHQDWRLDNLAALATLKADVAS